MEIYWTNNVIRRNFGYFKMNIVYAQKTSLYTSIDLVLILQTITAVVWY